MKKTLFTLAVAAIAAASAGSLAYKVSSASANRQPGDNDRELAVSIRQLTNRSTEGLVEQKNPRGGSMVDLQGRFQDLAIVKLDPEGDAAAACVASLEEANRFFGRDLETGEVYRSSYTDTEEYLRTKHAGAPAMTVEEFLFYKEMIRRAAPKLIGGTGVPESNSETGTGGTATPPSSSFSSDLTTNTTTINIINADGAGEGFNDATAKAAEGGNNGTTLGAQRLNVFNFAAQIWAANLDSTVPINVSAQFNPLACTNTSATLGSAGANRLHFNFPGAPFADTLYPEALANKLSGSDQSAEADINARFNSDIDNGCFGNGKTFYYGLDNSTPSGKVNILVVILHELGHGLGFQTFADETSGAQFAGMSDMFDRHIFDRTTGKFWNQMTDKERVDSALNTGNLLWDGPNVNGASGSLTAGRDTTNGRVQLYAPNPVKTGSSISHWDTAATPNLLMEPNITVGLPLTLDLTRQEMRDIGWYRDVNGDRQADTITNVAVSGTNLPVGSSAQVTWTNGGGFAGNVSVELSTDGGATFPITLASNVVNNGFLTFTVPNNATTQAKIRVREYDFVSPVGTSANFTILASTPANSFIQFSSSNYSVSESGGHFDVTVTRTGDTSGAATVNYTTADQSGAGHASQTSDYETATGTLSFAAGQTSKTFRILIVDDLLVEGNETIDLVLWNPTGLNVTLGSPITSQLTIVDNDTVASTTNPYDDARFFVRQHYLDFLNREPDQGGWDFWTNQITSCGTDTTCIEIRRINVSAAYYLSNEFQNTGFEAYVTHRSAFGPTAPNSPVPLLYTTFMHDVQELGNGYIFGQAGADAVLEANKVAYFNEFVNRPEFLSKYPAGLSSAQFADALLATAGLSTTGTFRDSLLTKTRAAALRAVAESSTIQSHEFNNAFVAMEYFGYLRRDPDTAGYNFWLGKLNAFNGNYINAEMVKAFITATEVRQRFGP
jgi:hypothetical protein